MRRDYTLPPPISSPVCRWPPVEHWNSVQRRIQGRSEKDASDVPKGAYIYALDTSRYLLLMRAEEHWTTAICLLRRLAAARWPLRRGRIAAPEQWLQRFLIRLF